MLTDKIVYKDITARKIICCEGTAGYESPYFSLLPYTQNKGELLIASIPDLPQAHIFQQGIKIAPWRDGLWWIGSSFEWKFSDAGPTGRFREQVEAQLKNWLKLPYQIKDHMASTRPTTVDYKPFAGLHPVHSAVGILNGMGTKGCSLAPYFARQFSDYLLHQKPLLPEADIRRFALILSRQ